MTGPVVSTTSTSNEEWVMLLAASVAVQLTIVWPSANVVPEAGAQDTETGPSNASVAVGVTYETVEPAGPAASTTRSAWAGITGPVVSSTRTSKDEWVVLCAASVAEQLTVVWPRANRLPEAGAQATGTEPSTASLALGAV